MWDQPNGAISIARYTRIIPTYVGSTLPRFRRQLLQTNHSHVCGINATEPAAIANHFESFPRMWDQLKRHPTSPGTVPNHSHVCGINQHGTVADTYGAESFPRMWDQPKKVEAVLNGHRIIPTYVGSTGNPGPIPSSKTNHSHVCGIN